MDHILASRFNLFLDDLRLLCERHQAIIRSDGTLRIPLSEEQVCEEDYAFFTNLNADELRVSCRTRDCEFISVTAFAPLFSADRDS